MKKMIWFFLQAIDSFGFRNDEDDTSIIHSVAVAAAAAADDGNDCNVKTISPWVMTGEHGELCWWTNKRRQMYK